MNLHKLNRILLQTLLLPVIALMLVSAMLVSQILTAERTVASIQVTDNNIATANLISALVADEETGVRGYQNTSNEIFLQPYEMSVVPLRESIAKLRAGIASQQGNLAPVDELEAAHQQWVATIAEPMIATIRDGGNTRDPGINLRGKASMDYVREIIAGINSTQKADRTLEVEHWQAQVRLTLEQAVSFALFIGLLIGAFTRNRLHMVSQAFQNTLDALRRHSQSTYDSEQRLRAILTSIGEAVLVCDDHGRVELLNAVAQQLLGWRQYEALRLPIDDVLRLVDEANRDLLETPFATVKRAHHASHPVHALLLHREGTQVLVEASGAPIFDVAGKLAGVVIVIRDVTEQRRTQTALLASEKLAVAGRLAATIAHEIHNPLDAVVNLIYLLKTGATPEEQTQFLDMASAELDRVTHISRAMLGLYRESRMPVALSVKEILESVLVLLDRRLAQASVSVHTKFAADVIVTGFPAELRQVFTNLLTNAADVSPAGSRIDIDVRRQPAHRGKGSIAPTPEGVTITITDFGPGIPVETLEQIFQPFFTTKGEQGTGLGLWVSQGIVQKHGGTIRVETSTASEDHGTTITVFLPRGEAELPSPARA